MIEPNTALSILFLTASAAIVGLCAIEFLSWRRNRRDYDAPDAELELFIHEAIREDEEARK